MNPLALEFLAGTGKKRCPRKHDRELARRRRKIARRSRKRNRVRAQQKRRANRARRRRGS